MRKLKYHIETGDKDTLCGRGGGHYRNNFRSKEFFNLGKKEQCQNCRRIYLSKDGVEE